MDSSGNGNGWIKKSGMKGLQMFAADVVGNVVELIFLKNQEQFDRTFPVLKSTFKAAMYIPGKILQTPIEWVLSTFPSIEGKESMNARMQKTETQRLDDLLETSYHYAAAVGVGWGSLIITEKGLSRVMGTKELPGRMWSHVDLPVHVGTAAFLGTSMMKPVTGSIKDFTKKIMVAAGWSEEKAEQDSRFAVAYILPNYLTLLPTVGMMTGLYKAESNKVLHDVGAERTAWYGLKSHEHHFVPTGKPALTQELGVPTMAMLKAAEKLGVIGKAQAAHMANV